MALFFYEKKIALLRPDIRIRIRRRIIRIRVTETCIRTIIRIAAEQES
jgi:hypothetical protein